MNNISITTSGVQKLLANLKTDKAMGPDEIHPSILKNLSSELSSVISHIFQQSLDTGSIPDDWKKANISPIYKKSDRSIPANYRPVSLTCICCKLLEHIITSNLMLHFDNHNILVDNQHAFRRNRSCETQLIHTIDDWASSLDKNLQIDSFVLDFEKAFDTVPYELLKTKLHMYGVSKQCLAWISDFLSSRSQRVVLNGTKSSSSKVISGVPQGTVLCPVLFLVHINDILKNTSSTIKLFADDCVYYRPIFSDEDCVRLQNDIDTGRGVPWRSLGRICDLEFGRATCFFEMVAFRATNFFRILSHVVPL